MVGRDNIFDFLILLFQVISQMRGQVKKFKKEMDKMKDNDNAEIFLMSEINYQEDPSQSRLEIINWERGVKIQDGEEGKTSSGSGNNVSAICNIM